MIQPEDEEPDNSPGCIVWGLVGVFMVLLGFATVFMAIVAGWNDGLRVAVGNATATKNSDISTQCERIPSDLVAGNVGLANQRLQSLLQLTPSVPCIATVAPQLTAYAITLTPQITPTTMLPTATAPAEVTAVVTPAPTSSSGYDLDALLFEAQNYLTSGDNTAAIDTLDAINAIDPTFQKVQVDQLLFTALTREASRLYLGGTNRAQAIILTTRAEQYGDIGELNYERFIAEIYLQAEANKNVNYPRAIQAYSRIVYEQGLPNYGNAQQALYDQYVKYADALLLGGDPCNAQTQYNNALDISSSSAVATQRDVAATQCSSGVIVGTPDPNQPAPTTDPNSGAVGTGTAPIGVRP
jgi:tetratricopeptide (TPR) repeat protein